MSKPEFVYVIYIASTPEKVFEALTDTEASRQYWHGNFVESDWKVGSPFALRLVRHEKETPPARCSNMIRRAACPIRSARRTTWTAARPRA